MSTLKTMFLGDGLYFDAAIAALRGAQSSVQLATFLMRTGYANETRANAFEAELIACRARGVDVLCIFNYARFEPDVALENYAVAQRLAAAGCRVRLGPLNQTLHAKILIVDGSIGFWGSHNITRGALTFNREVSSRTEVAALVHWLMRYFNQLWYAGFPLASAPPPTNVIPLVIELQGVAADGAELVLTFDANVTDGVDAFAAVAAGLGTLNGAVMGPTVTPETGVSPRVARVVPTVNPGAPVFVAVRGYNAGQVIGTSNVIQLTYQPSGTGGGNGDGDGDGGTEPPPPEPLTAPTLASVTQASETTVTAAWQFVGSATFNRFEIQQRDLMSNWHVIGMDLNAATREWTGTPVAMSESLPFRIVVFNLAEESAASNEVTLTGATPAPLTAPVLSSVVAGLNGTEITATWTCGSGVPPEDFHRFEIQKQVGTDWSVVGSTLDPSVRQWVGPGPGAGFTEATYRVVVFNLAEESAASNEVTITGEPPVSLTPPVLVSVTQIGPMGINVEYSHVTPAEFARYEVQQRTNETWNTLATITTPETRSWSGGPIPYMDADHPVRVVVFVQSGDSAGSNEMVITPM